MNYLIEFFARRGQFSDLITFFILGVGILAAVTIKREVFPNISYEIVTVSTAYPGASAEENEKFVVSPLEQDLLEVDGIKVMRSVSAEGRSYIILQVDPNSGTEEQVKADVQDVVDRFQLDLPSDAETPIVQTIKSQIIPIVEIALFGDLPEGELRALARKTEKQLGRISQVARVDFNGMRDYEIQVQAKAGALRRYEISLDEVIAALQRQNVSIPGGTLVSEATDKEMVVRTIGEFSDIEDVKNTVIRSNALAQAIRVKDVADVELVFADAEILYRANGKRAINLTVSKKQNADAVDLVNRVKEVTEQIREKEGQSFEVAYINDLSYYIKRRLSVLSNNLLIGLALVLLVLSLVLPFRVALVTGIGIPFSFLGAMLYFQYADVSLNLITMMGLIIVIGMLVDDAIVVTENAQRKFEEGLPPLDAAIAGTQEVWAPVTASVLTTIMAFAPMLSMSGIFGKFIAFIPLGVIVALTFSLYECFFVLPHHFAQWGFGKDKSSDKGYRSPRPAPLAGLWEAYVNPAYASFVNTIVRGRYVVGFIAVAVFVGSLFMVVEKMKFVLFPSDGVEIFQIDLNMPVGTSLAKTTEVVKVIEQEVKKLPKQFMDDFATKIGIQQRSPDDPNVKRGDEFAQFFVFLTPATERETTAKELMDQLKDKIGTPAGVEKITFQQVKGGPPVGKPVSVSVQGKEYADILSAVDSLKQIVAAIPGASDVTSSYSPGKQEIRLELNQAEMAAAGLTALQVGTTVRAAYEGVEATSIQELEEETIVRVRLKGFQQLSEKSLSKLRVANPAGQLIPLGQITSLSQKEGVYVYEHQDNERQVKVTAELEEDQTTSTEATSLIASKLPELKKKHKGVSFKFGGEEEDTQESLASLQRAFLIAVFGIYLIMVLIFESYIRPFLVISVIPLGIVGVIWAFYFHDRPISFLALVGVVALSGVIVNNGIVFVDFVNRQRRLGEDRFESLISAARMRLRPIVLTTVTTSVGILPTAYGLGGLDPFVVPIALSLGYGVLIGSIMTLVVFPASYAIMDDLLSLVGVHTES
jgi:multidrug efflux pump subunit AcrB